MTKTIYIKLLRYFVGLIVTTCLVSALLFLFTVGRPMARDIHRLLRDHTHLIALHIEQMISDGHSMDQVRSFIKKTADTYEMAVVLIGPTRHAIVSVPESAAPNAILSDAMLEQIRQQGRFVQPGHLGKPTIYVLSLAVGTSLPHYLYITKQASMVRPVLMLLLGLMFICILLTIAIYPLARGFTRPISELTRAVDQIARGNFSPHLIVNRREDELGDLLQVFERMSRSVKEMIASRKQLLADISHEMRSPLARIEVLTELLREKCSDENARQHLYLISEEIRFMDEMIYSLSVYSMINLPNFALRLQSINPSTLIEEAYVRYAHIVAAKGFSFQRKIGPCQGTVMLDREQMDRVLNNLLDNALQFCSPAGTITLEVTEGYSAFQFFVCDTGQGVAEHLREKIFEPLFRADSSRSHGIGGTGLGLAICKKIVTLHGGSITYRREAGTSRFAVELPKKRNTKEEEQ